MEFPLTKRVKNVQIKTIKRKKSAVYKKEKNQSNQNKENIKAKFLKALTLTRMQQALLEEKPHIIHFSGHGKGDAGVEAMISGARDIAGFDMTKDDTGIIPFFRTLCADC